VGPPLLIRLYLFCPLQVLKVESTWHIRTECPELLVELVEWIRRPWEEMFSIELRRAVYEGLECACQLWAGRTWSHECCGAGSGAQTCPLPPDLAVLWPLLSTLVLPLTLSGEEEGSTQWSRLCTVTHLHWAGRGRRRLEMFLVMLCKLHRILTWWCLLVSFGIVRSVTEEGS